MENNCLYLSVKMSKGIERRALELNISGGSTIQSGDQWGGAH